MIVLIDLNVLLDVIQRRTPHYSDSAAVLSRARTGDFEDAVVASLAHASSCAFIITRNQIEFTGAPVPAISPAAFLASLNQPNPDDS